MIWGFDVFWTQDVIIWGFEVFWTRECWFEMLRFLNTGMLIWDFLNTGYADWCFLNTVYTCCFEVLRFSEHRVCWSMFFWTLGIHAALRFCCFLNRGYTCCFEVLRFSEHRRYCFLRFSICQTSPLNTVETEGRQTKEWLGVVKNGVWRSYVGATV
jgi:hypothetical protein